MKQGNSGSDISLFSHFARKKCRKVVEVQAPNTGFRMFSKVVCGQGPNTEFRIFVGKKRENKLDFQKKNRIFDKNSGFRFSRNVS